MPNGAHASQALTADEKLFLNVVKKQNFKNLIKNTPQEILNISYTYCGDVYYKSTLDALYKKNHYVESAKTTVLLMKYAGMYICTKKMEVINPDGSSTTVYIYDQNSKTVDGGTIYGSGDGMGKTDQGK
jgi:hypothetical protein